MAVSTLTCIGALKAGLSAEQADAVFRETDGDIKLVGVPTKVIALFEMLGLLALFETHETIEDAVASFGAGGGEAGGGAEGEGEGAAAAVQFPIQFKHPVSGMGLNVSQPGRFKDPRSGDYFSVSNDGTIEFYEMSKVRMLDLKVPADPTYATGLMAMATALAKSQGLSDDVAGDIERSIDEACGLIGRNATDSGETCNFLLVAEKDKVQIGIVSYGSALNVQNGDPAFQVIQQSMDEVKHQVLPTRGFLLTMIIGVTGIGASLPIGVVLVRRAGQAMADDDAGGRSAPTT